MFLYTQHETLLMTIQSKSHLKGYFITKDSGVSTLIGVILIMAIVIGFIGLLQSLWLPEWNKQIESRHLDTLSYETSKMSEIITTSTKSSKLVIDAGLKYPQVPLLISPTYSSATISAKKLNVTINSRVYETYAITVKPNYYYLSSPTFIYEHTAVFKRFSGSNLLNISSPASFTKNRIELYLINASFETFSTVDDASFVIYPASHGGEAKYDTLTISFESYDNDTARWWQDMLNETYGDTNVSRSGNLITLNLHNIYLSLNYLVMAREGVGITHTPTLSLVNISEKDYDVYRGVTVPLGVRVVDEYSNPVPNIAINVDVSPNSASNPDTTLTSNDEGEVWYYFKADASGNYGIGFSIPSDSETFRVNVSSPPSTGTFDITWNVSSPYDWNVSQSSSCNDFGVTVYYDSSPVVGTRVDFSHTGSIITLVNPSFDDTDGNGKANVTVCVNDNGTASVIASTGDSTSILELNVSGAGGVNLQPVANFTYSPPYPAVGETVTFDASSSYDPDGGSIISYYWDLDNDGAYDDDSGVTTSYSFPSWGTYTIGLMVVDDEGSTNTTSMNIYIGDLVYNNDAVARDGADSGAIRGGVEFTITNRFSATATIDRIKIDPINDNINKLSDNVWPNNLPAYTEVYVDADTDSYSDFYGGITIPPDGVTIDLGVDGNVTSGTDAILNSGSTATFYLYEFYRDTNNQNMVNQDVTITLYYSVGGVSKVKTFTITPS